jgi:hypothetical protein
VAEGDVVGAEVEFGGAGVYHSGDIRVVADADVAAAVEKGAAIAEDDMASGQLGLAEVRMEMEGIVAVLEDTVADPEPTALGTTMEDIRQEMLEVDKQSAPNCHMVLCAGWEGEGKILDSKSLPWVLGKIDQQDQHYDTLADLDAHHRLAAGMDPAAEVDEHKVQEDPQDEGADSAKIESGVHGSYDAELGRTRLTDDEGHESIVD